LERVAKETLDGGGPITGEDAEALLAKGIKKLNEAAEKGLVKFGRHNGQVVVTPTAQAVGEDPPSATPPRRRDHSSTGTVIDSNSRISAQGCGNTKYKGETPGISNPMFRHEFMTNDEDSAYLAHKLKEGAVVVGVLSAIFGALAGMVVGTAPGLIASVVCAILAGVAAIVADDINYKNEGCGVILHIDHLPVYGPVVPPVPELTFNYSVETQ
jgi:hypothetical protein